MADYGLKVSKDGYDVLTAIDLNLAFTSKYNVFKVKVDGSGTLSANSNVNISHGLGYIPHFLVFVEDTGGDMRIANGSGFIASEQFEAYADTTNVNIRNRDTSNAKDYYYYIFYDPS